MKTGDFVKQFRKTQLFCSYCETEASKKRKANQYSSEDSNDASTSNDTLASMRMELDSEDQPGHGIELSSSSRLKKFQKVARILLIPSSMILFYVLKK